jgi:hypothetical protein
MWHYTPPRSPSLLCMYHLCTIPHSTPHPMHLHLQPMHHPMHLPSNLAMRILHNQLTAIALPPPQPTKPCTINQRTNLARSTNVQTLHDQPTYKPCTINQRTNMHDQPTYKHARPTNVQTLQAAEVCTHSRTRPTHLRTRSTHLRISHPPSPPLTHPHPWCALTY